MDQLRHFFSHPAAGGILLALSAALALIIVNSPWRELYEGFLAIPVAIQIGPLEIAKPLLLWINDGLMAIFFFLVGLEIKREVYEGALSSIGQAVLPLIAALGGVALPAALYLAVAGDSPLTARGWAIPAATDIAFTLGVLALLRTRVPISIKIFVTAVAIIDDLAAILIIAAFYTDQISLISLLIAGGAAVFMAALNLRGVTAIVPYILIGVVMWVAVLKSGVHATLAGVVIALFIPLRPKDSEGESPLTRLEHDLHPAVTFAILPLFGFANSGVSLAGLTFERLLEPIPLGIALGLFVGKQIGIFVATAIPIFLRLAPMPEAATWRHLYGAAALCGIGFTMSLFIGSLAFDAPEDVASVRLGVLGGSLLSGLWGAAIFLSARPPAPGAAMGAR
ncbi:MAG: Na+/H+ antiporter NhaA [Alphaproteobacteria bacterium]|nr:Na+/H+ antiporter NhaA [Alphaproteobacteria bacterium]